MNSSSIPTRKPIVLAEVDRRKDASNHDLDEITDLSDCDFLPMDTSGQEQSYAEMSFRFCDLARSYLHDANYAHSDFECLPGVHIHNANMRATCFKRAKIFSSTLTESDFKGADFDSADMTRLVAKNCFFEGTKFDDVTWEDGELVNSNASSATFRRSNLRGLDAQQSKFIGCSFLAAHLENVNFSGGSLAFANLTGAHIAGTIMEKTDLTGTNMHGVLFGPDTLAGEYHLIEANTEMIQRCLWKLCDQCPDRSLIEQYMKQISDDAFIRKCYKERKPINNLFFSLTPNYSPAILLYRDSVYRKETEEDLYQRPAWMKRALETEIQCAMESPLDHPEWIVQFFLNGLKPLVFENKHIHPDYNPIPFLHLLRKWLEQWLSRKA